MNINTAMVVLSVVAGAAIFAYQSRISRRAARIAEQYAQKHGFQFLDQTVVLVGLKIVASKRALLQLRRTYRFEFSLKGDRRYLGWLVMTGHTITKITLEPVREQDLP